MKLTFLGTGTSIGVPAIGCSCEVCRSHDTRDKRLRSSAIIETDEGLRILHKVAAGKGNSRLKKCELAEPLTLEDMQAEAQVLQTVDASEVKNAFMASSDNLFHFVMNYSNYRKSMDEEEKLVLFCQIATQYLDELTVEDNYQTRGNIEYPLIYSKQN